jgi:hypothetical protein
MNFSGELERRVSSWPEVSVYPHRFGGREFQFRDAEIGHVHTGGMVDIPFPRPVRDALLAEALAERHPWIPDSGWITYRVRDEGGLQHALWLMRLSYLRYVLRSAPNPAALLETESEQLHLSPRFKALLEALLPKSARQAPPAAAPA